MSSFRASEVVDISAHLTILRRAVTEIVPLSAEAIGERRAEGVGVYSFLTAVVLTLVFVMGATSLTAPLPWGLAALSIHWDRNEEILFAVGSDPSEVRISSLAELKRPGSSKLSQKIAAKAGSLEGGVVAEWFDSIGAPDAAKTVRDQLTRIRFERFVDALLAGVLLMVTPLVVSTIALRVADTPVDMEAGDLAAPLALWTGLWGIVPLPFAVALLLFPYSDPVATVATLVSFGVVAGGAWQLHLILNGLAASELKQSLIVYGLSWLILWGADVALGLGLSGLLG